MYQRSHSWCARRLCVDAVRSEVEWNLTTAECTRCVGRTSVERRSNVGLTSAAVLCAFMRDIAAAAAAGYRVCREWKARRLQRGCKNRDVPIFHSGSDHFPSTFRTACRCKPWLECNVRAPPSCNHPDGLRPPGAAAAVDYIGSISVNGMQQLAVSRLQQTISTRSR